MFRSIYHLLPFNERGVQEPLAVNSVAETRLFRALQRTDGLALHRPCAIS